MEHHKMVLKTTGKTKIEAKNNSLKVNGHELYSNNEKLKDSMNV